MLVDNPPKPMRHLIQRRIPRNLPQAGGVCRSAFALMRVKQAPVERHGFAQRRAFDAETAEVGGMRLIPLDFKLSIRLQSGAHAATHSAIGARRMGSLVQDRDHGGIHGVALRLTPLVLRIRHGQTTVCCATPARRSASGSGRNTRGHL